MRAIRTQLDDTHPDYPVLSMLRDEIELKSGGIKGLTKKFPVLVRDAVDFVLDPVRTARASLNNELDNVEKTFIGLKLEHFVRDMLNVPKELRDLKIKGMHVDIKNTVRDNWSIPLETYRASEPCLLMAVDEGRHTCFLGLIVAKAEYLHAGKGNRDTKKGVSKAGFANILWLVKNEPFPQSKFNGLNMDRFRKLRKTLLGNDRAAQFARENLRRIVHRDVIKALLFDQNDYMKRLRANGGAPDTLRREGVAILIGTFLKDRKLAADLKLMDLRADEVVAVKPRTPAEVALMRQANVIV
jgi:hypothetical protein